MKAIVLKTTILAVALMFGVSNIDAKKPTKFKENWESLLRVNEEPDWFVDAKFGIYAHWGPVSEALEGADPKAWYGGWHGKLMYEDGKIFKTKSGNPTNNFLLHEKKYGPVKENGYVKVIEAFEPTGFDAKEWAELFAESGAKFAGPVAMHHDNFAMWDAKSTRWNSMNYGGIDPSAALKKEIESRGMKFMGSFHHAFTWEYFAGSHIHGGIDKKDYDLYTDNTPGTTEISERFNKEWWAKLKEFIDVYEPDMVWFDWWLEELPEEWRKKFLAYYYNKGQAWGKDVAVCYKEKTFPEETGILDYERGRPNQPKDRVWLTDTSPGAWFYRPGAKFVSSNELVDILIDIVAKNGCMLLNVPPNPDGSIPEDMKRLLRDMGAWLKVNGDAIYGTRPYKVFGEGPTRLPEGGHKVEKIKIEYKDTDIRYVKKSNNEIYAIVMDTPEFDIVMKTLSTDIGVLNSNIKKVELLGSDEKLTWKRDARGLVIKTPKSFPTEYAHAFKITVEGYSENDIGGDVDAHVD